MDVLHHIRNALAHGRFTVKKHEKDYYVYLEDVTRIRRLDGLFVTGRMCFKKSTLVDLIDFLEYKKTSNISLDNLRCNE